MESVIDEMEAVRGVCVFGVADPKWGEAVKAVIEADADVISADDVREYVGSKIGRFKRPSKVEFVAVIARADDGSVDREAVKAEFGDQT